MSSPAPNLSPTSFIAGSRTSLRTGTAPISSTPRSIQSSTPSLRRRRMWKCSASAGVMPVRRVRDRVGLLGAGRLDVRDEALEGVLAAVQDEVVGELALVRRRSPRTGVMWFGFTIARSSPASTQWCRKTLLRIARAGCETPKLTLDTPRDVLHARQRLLHAADALDRLDGARAPLGVAGREGEREDVEDEQLAGEPVRVGEPGDPLGDLDLALGRLRHALLVDGERDERGAVLDGERRDAVELRRSRPRGSRS